MSTFKINPTKYENYIFLKFGELGVCLKDDYEIEIATGIIHDIAVSIVNAIAKDNVNDGLEHKRIIEVINASIKDIADAVDKAIKTERSKLGISDESKLAIINTVYLGVNDAYEKLNECMTKTLFNASVTDTSGHKRAMVSDDLNKAINATTVNEIWKVLSALKELTDVLERQRVNTIFDDNCTESSKAETRAETSGTSTNKNCNRVKPINYDDIVRATRQAKNELTELLEAFGIFLS